MGAETAVGAPGIPIADMPVVVMADDLDKLLRAYIASGRTAENAAECDPVWERLHARLKAMQACRSCAEADARAASSPMRKGR